MVSPERIQTQIKRAEIDYHHHSGELVNVDVTFDVEVTKRYGRVEAFAR